jgi:RNA polymerase sigma-70 factor (ECF subfamily)
MLFDGELIESLPDAIAKLSPASQIVLRMHYLEGLTYVEIAEALEISVGTVKSRVAYGLSGLRKTVGQ